MKEKFILFSGNDDYPLGGFNDLDGIFETLNETLKCFKKIDPEWAQIVKFSNDEFVFLFDYGKFGPGFPETEDKLLREWRERKNNKIIKL